MCQNLFLNYINLKNYEIIFLSDIRNFDSAKRQM